MKTYLFLILLIAIAIPMAIKFSINNFGANTGAAAPGPCMLNNSLNNDPLQDRYLPRNLENITKTDAFQPSLDNRPHKRMINIDRDQDEATNRVGQNCQFGQCAPGTQQQPTNVVDFE